MNNDRRKQLRKAIELINEAKLKIDEAYTIVDSCADDEQDAFDNLSENLQCSERGNAMENAIASLEEARDGLDEMSESADSVCSSIEEAIE